MKWNPTTMSLVTILLLLSGVCVTRAALSKANLSAAEILAKVDAAAKADTSKVYMTQTVIAPSGDTRTFKMVTYSKGQNDKGLTEYLAPSQVKGMKILSLNEGDDIWTYFPSTNRVRKIASSARNRRVQGSDFSYEDMATGKMATSWQGTVFGEEKIGSVDCYKLALTPTSKGPKGYKKVTAWVSKRDSTSMRVLYFDKYGEKSKQLDIEDYHDVSGVKVPFKYTMTNLLDGGKTIMKVAHAEVNIKLDDSLFTESGLKK
ncbi:MAG: outer membrane lipoprotein-sorting protein [Deltaproteobacteria bacterium]|nr:outer membrane lipoprotein-sorting protein [Deltaproteobacteria bacterium]MBN2672835.1 outer membrane lipoprotein-sorting protein [Deltaproteobacteria bacterium]